MMLPDVNVLIQAFRSDMASHGACRAWLEEMTAANEAFGISTLVLSAVARITTNARIFAQPNRLEDAFAFTNALLAQPHCERIEPGEQHWGIFCSLCAKTNTKGSRISDVWLAALAIEHRCTFVTLDRDFARFPGLAWRAP